MGKFSVCLLNKLKIVEKVTAQRGNVQPVLANILFEAENNVLNLSATDLEISIKAKTTVAVKKEGKITHESFFVLSTH